MSWVAQFGISNLTLEINSDVFQGGNSSRRRQVIDLALRGKLKQLKREIGKESCPVEKEYLTQFALTVLHEQRHFLDVSLSNVGAGIVEHHLLVCETAGKFALTKDNDVAIPIRSNFDEIAASILGVSLAVDDGFFDLHSKRQRIQAKENSLREGIIELGWFAQLEQLAAIFDSHNHRTLWPKSFLQCVKAKDRERAVPNSNRYSWLFDLCINLQGNGCNVCTAIYDSMAIVSSPFMICLLFSSLQVRRLPGRSNEKSHHASHRLDSLIQHVIKVKYDCSMKSFVQVWQDFNEFCHAVFGKTILEEIEADLQYSAEKLHKLSNASDSLRKFLSLLLGFRRRLFLYLKYMPEKLLDPEQYFSDFLSKTRPFTVFLYGAAPIDQDFSGVGETPLLRGRLGTGSAVPDVVWSTSRAISGDDDTSKFLTLGDFGFQREIRDYLISGEFLCEGRTNVRRRPVDYFAIEQTLGDLKRFVLDPDFAYPHDVELRPLSPSLSIFRKDRFFCDRCGVEILSADTDAKLMLCWFTRKYDKVRENLIEKYQEEQRVNRETAAMWFNIDQSDWIVCKKCAVILEECK